MVKWIILFALAGCGRPSWGQYPSDLPEPSLTPQVVRLAGRVQHQCLIPRPAANFLVQLYNDDYLVAQATSDPNGQFHLGAEILAWRGPRLRLEGQDRPLAHSETYVDIHLTCSSTVTAVLAVEQRARAGDPRVDRSQQDPTGTPNRPLTEGTTAPPPGVQR